MDRPPADAFIDGNALDPLLGSDVLRGHLVALDEAMDHGYRADGTWRHRIVFRDGYFRGNDDRSQFGLCFAGTMPALDVG